MKTKATLIAVLFAATGTSFASGLSIDSVDESNIQATNNVEITEIKVQGPTDAFNVMVKSSDKEKVDTSSLKQAYDGRS